MSSAQDLDRSGQTLGDYQLIRRLGRGGMADVYLAQQSSLDRPVALKLLKPHLAEDANYVRRFHNEAKAAAALIHPNIVQIYEVGQHDGLHFIAQEYVAGKTLKQVLDNVGSFAAGKAVVILRQIVAALHKAHQLGIVHRDVKPDNVLMDEEGVAKVADFGLAKQACSDELGLTTTGMTMGTPFYMSPEQVQGQSVDSRSDIYSLGVTAFQMLSGRLPFEGDTPMSVALKQVNAPTPNLRDANSELPFDLCAAVERMMAKQPHDRYESPAELARELQRIGAVLDGSEPLSAASAVAVAEAERGPAGSRTAAADRLATVLKQAQQGKTSNRRWVGVLLCGLLGAFFARRAIQVDPLASGDVVVAVPQKDSPRSQYAYASLVNTKAAWEAVLDYYPEGGTAERQRYYALRAKTQLARWYLENGDATNAAGMFQQLADLDATEREFRAMGIAGLALCYEATGNLTSAADLLTDAMPLIDELDDTTKKRLARLEHRLTTAAQD